MALCPFNWRLDRIKPTINFVSFFSEKSLKAVEERVMCLLIIIIDVDCRSRKSCENCQKKQKKVFFCCRFFCISEFIRPQNQRISSEIYFCPHESNIINLFSFHSCFVEFSRNKWFHCPVWNKKWSWALVTASASFLFARNFKTRLGWRAKLMLLFHKNFLHQWRGWKTFHFQSLSISWYQ